MALKFYKSESIELPNGDKVELLPMTVEDMELVMSFIDIQKEITTIRKGRSKDKDGEILKINTKEFYPKAWKIAQRNIKRLDPVNKDLNVDELDKVADIPMSVTMASQIAVKVIEISMDSGVDIKKIQPPVVEKPPQKKSSEE